MSSRKRTGRKGGKRNNNATGKQFLKKVARAQENEVDGVPLLRKCLNFKPIGTNAAYHFIRRTTTINSFTATGGSFVTNGSIATFAQSAAVTPVDVFLALAFRLDDLPDYAEFTNLFDQFCILGVQIRISPRVSNATVSTSANTGTQFLYGVLDRSDITLPTSMQQLREYQTLKTWTTTTETNRPWTIKMSPRIAVAAYSGAFSGYSAPGLTWIDAQSPSVQHYGIKLGIPAGFTAGTVTFYDMDFCYHIACRMAQ